MERWNLDYYFLLYIIFSNNYIHNGTLRGSSAKGHWTHAKQGVQCPFNERHNLQNIFKKLLFLYLKAQSGNLIKFIKKIYFLHRWTRSSPVYSSLHQQLNGVVSLLFRIQIFLPKLILSYLNNKKFDKLAQFFN